MGFWNKIFGKKEAGETRIGGMEDFMTLIRVYFQASMAADLGITSLAALPDLRVFKSTLKVATVNNKLGVGERSRCKNMLKQMYDMDDDFFKEIDSSSISAYKAVVVILLIIISSPYIRKRFDDLKNKRLAAKAQANVGKEAN